MKKDLLLIIVIIILFILTNHKFNITNTPELKGTKINEYLYSYSLNPELKEWNNYYALDDNIYYLLGDNTNSDYIYELYKRNIYGTKNQKILEFTKPNAYCNLINNYIQCIDDTTISLYDYNFNNIYSTNFTTNEDFPKIVPYKDTYLKIINNTIYINQNNKDVKFKDLPLEFSKCFITNDFVTNDNTYLLFQELETNNYYVYNVLHNNYEKITSKNSIKYSNGFYFYDASTYYIYNLNTNELKEYKNLYQNSFYYNSTLRDNTLFINDIASPNINIINLEDQTIMRIKLDILAQDSISDMTIDNNYLYLTLLEDKSKLFIVNLNNIDNSKIKIEEDIELEEDQINKALARIKNNYNINIHIRDKAIIKFPDFKAEEENNKEIIINALTKIENILSKYNQDLFDNFYLNGYDGLNIYLTGTLTPNNIKTQISNPAAYSTIYQNKYLIALDITKSNIEKLICHELLHNLEFVAKNLSIYPFNDWNNLNPQDFTYNNSYTKNSNNKYTMQEDDLKNVYFIDTYSHSYETEDRARIFENICSCNKDSIVNKYPHLYEKGLYLKEELYKSFPSLIDTHLFDSLD